MKWTEIRLRSRVKQVLAICVMIKPGQSLVLAAGQPEHVRPSYFVPDTAFFKPGEHWVGYSSIQTSSKVQVFLDYLNANDFLQFATLPSGGRLSVSSCSDQRTLAPLSLTQSSQWISNCMKHGLQI